MNPKSITDIKAFLPSKDYELSKLFYRDIGFQMNFTNSEVTEFEIDKQKFLLTPFYVKEHLENFMMQLMVKDVYAWWEDLNKIEIGKRYPGIMFREPKVQPWGLNILYLSDPSGVLWHIAQDPNA